MSLTDAELDAAAALIVQLKTALAPLEHLQRGKHAIAAIARLHARVVSDIGGMTPELADAFDEIEEAGALDVSPGDYVELFHAAITGKKIYAIR